MTLRQCVMKRIKQLYSILFVKCLYREPDELSIAI